MRHWNFNPTPTPADRLLVLEQEWHLAPSDQERFRLEIEAAGLATQIHSDRLCAQCSVFLAQADDLCTTCWEDFYGDMRRNPDPDLQKKLRFLELDYFDQSPFIRKKDLVTINQLRKQLNLPQVDSNLREITEEQIQAEEPAPIPVVAKVDPFAQVREFYASYLAKEAQMAPHRQYCEAVIQATQPRSGMTPVEPLATMGTAGGQLLCDACEKPIPLEGGIFNNMSAGQAYMDERCPNYSFIRGGVTFLQEENGTLRVYHGYPGGRCMNQAEKELETRRAAHVRPKLPPTSLLREFLQVEIGINDPEEVRRLANHINSTMAGFDPGIGINRPL